MSKRKKARGWDSWLSRLPENHRRASTKATPAEEEWERRNPRPHMEDDKISKKDARSLASFFQIAYADGKIGRSKGITWKEVEQLFREYDGYADLEELLIVLASDLCGNGYPMGIGFEEYGARGKVPHPERDNIIRHGINPEAHDRTWLLVLTADHEAGGEIYFPAYKEHECLEPGTIIVFSRNTRWGVSPVGEYDWQHHGGRKAVIRMLVGWGALNTKAAADAGFPVKITEDRVRRSLEVGLLRDLEGTPEVLGNE